LPITIGARVIDSTPIIFAGLVGAAEKDFVEPCPVDLRIARDQGPDRRRREVVGAHLGERPGITTDGGARRIADEDLSHRRILSASFFGCRALSRA
jgi:hypothetical protein